MKQCPKCKEYKPLSEFYEHKNINVCKVCHIAAGRRWAKNNPEKRTAINKRWREEHPEKHRANALQWRKNNREKSCSIARQWKKSNPEKLALQAKGYKPKRRKLRRKVLYGLSEVQYDNMLLEQKQSCAICGKHESNFVCRLGVDHCHKTKKIRGLLCNKCNSGIGFFDDDLEIVANALSYLTKFSINLSKSIWPVVRVVNR